MQRAGGSFQLRPPGGGQHGGPADSPSSLSLNGLGGLDMGQGSLTSNALFGSLNLEEILNGREMAGQGQDLMHSMRAAEAAQRAGHHLARGGGGGGSGSAAGQASGVPAPSGGSGGGGGIDMGGGPSQMGVGQGGSATLPSSAPEFGGFPSAEATAGDKRSADEIWKGLNVELGGAWPSHSSQPGGGSQQGRGGPTTLAPDLGGYLPIDGVNPNGGGGGGGLQHQHPQQPALPQLNGQHASGLGPAMHSLNSSLSSTGLTHGLGQMGMYSSGSTEVASHLLASSGGSGWYSALGLQQGQPGGSHLSVHSGGGGNGPGGPSGLSSTYDSLLGSPALGAPGAVPSAAFGRGGLAGQHSAGSYHPGMQFNSGGSGGGQYGGGGGHQSVPLPQHHSAEGIHELQRGGQQRHNQGMQGGSLSVPVSPRGGSLSPPPGGAGAPMRRGSYTHSGRGSPKFKPSHVGLPQMASAYSGGYPGEPGGLQRATLALSPGAASPQRSGPGPAYSNGGSAYTSREQSMSPSMQEGGYQMGYQSMPSLGRSDSRNAMPPPPTVIMNGSGRQVAMDPALLDGLSAQQAAQHAAQQAAQAAAAAAAAAARVARSGYGRPTSSTKRSSAELAGSAPSSGEGFPEIPRPSVSGTSTGGGSGGGGSGGSVPRLLSQPQKRGGVHSRANAERAKGRPCDKDERDAKRKEANRESAARSRDKRLKLIADLEVEVQALKKQHTEFKMKVLESTVPKPAVLGDASDVAARARMLRRVRTDPADCEAQIRRAFQTEGMDLAAAMAAVGQGPTTPSPAPDSAQAAPADAGTAKTETGAAKAEAAGAPAMAVKMEQGDVAPAAAAAAAKDAGTATADAPGASTEAAAAPAAGATDSAK